MSASGQVNAFGVVDYLVFSSMLAISALTGIYHAFAKGGQRTTSQFLVANREMNGIPIAMSLVVSFLSPITILGMPAETFANGAQYSLYVLCLFWVFPVVALILVPVFHGLKLTSAYEYMSLRFHFSLRIISSVLFIVQTSFYMAVTLIGPALALEAVLGFDVWKTVVITAVICTFYTTIGGMRAVIWTDVFQFFVIVGSFVTIIILGVIKAGGIVHVMEFNKDNGRLNFMETPFGVTTRLSAVALAVGGGMNTFPLYISQTAVQRYAASKTLRQAKLAVFLNMPFQLIMLPMVYFTGLVLYAFYNNYMTPLMPPLNNTLLNYTHETNFSSSLAGYYTPSQSTLSNFTLLSGNISAATIPDGVEARYVPDYSSADQIMVYFVSSQFGRIPGMQGLFVACIFAGTLSTMSSGLNALIAVTLQDMVRQWRKWVAKRTASEIYVNDARDTLISKVLTIAYGLLTLALAFVAQYMGPFVVISNTIFGTSGGPLLGVFSLGMFWKRSNACGALVGMIVGFVCGLWVSAGAIINKDALEIYKLSFMWYCTFSWLITVILGAIVSEIYRYFRPEIRDQEINPLLLATFLRPKNAVENVNESEEEETIKLEQMKIPNGHHALKEDEDYDDPHHDDAVAEKKTAQEYLL
ncbi:sodium-coupled monocarboxylate transporter 1-like [Ptychodera flava]|uniref:sodium-coupled monocarboxylate transporter 1-like n=1 Tax=Ptychodera flava TaxID=63121 RepID=UPI003969CBDE